MCISHLNDQPVLYPVKLAEPLNHIIFHYYHIGKSHPKFRMVLQLLLLANPNIRTERLVQPGELITLLPLNLHLLRTNTAIGAIYARVKLTPQQQQVRDRVVNILTRRYIDYENLWYLSWLHEQSNYLHKPDKAMSALLGMSNRRLIDEIAYHYVEYKKGNQSKGQYDYHRVKHMLTLHAHFKNMELWSLANKRPPNFKLMKCHTLPLSLKFNSALMRLIHFSESMDEQPIELAYAFKPISPKLRLASESFFYTLGTSMSNRFAVGLLFTASSTDWRFTLLFGKREKFHTALKQKIALLA